MLSHWAKAQNWKLVGFDLLAAGWEIRAAQALLWPNLKGSATGEAFSGEPTGKFGIVNTTSPSGGGVSTTSSVDLAGIGLFGLKLDYPIFQDGSIFGFNDAPAVELKRAQKDALAWTTHLTREDVIFRVTEVFIDTVSAQNRVQTHRPQSSSVRAICRYPKRRTAERIAPAGRCRGCHKTTQ